MSPYEDQLIAMGIEQFTPFYADYFGGSQEMVHLICSTVSQFMLPHWTAKQIETRIIAKCLPTSSANPIKVKTVEFYKIAFEKSVIKKSFLKFYLCILVLQGKPSSSICIPRDSAL